MRIQRRNKKFRIMPNGPTSKNEESYPNTPHLEMCWTQVLKKSWNNIGTNNKEEKVYHVKHK